MLTSERTHGNVREFVCGSMWIHAIQMWTCGIDSTKHQSSTDVTLVPTRYKQN